MNRPGWVTHWPVEPDEVAFWITQHCAHGFNPRYDAPHGKIVNARRSRTLRALAMVAARGQCADCRDSATEVHHLHYRTLGNETLLDVLPLCSACHELRHMIGVAQNA